MQPLASGSAARTRQTSRNMAVIKFPDIAAAKSWYASDAYQQIIPLREEASDMSLVLHEVPS